MYLIFKKNMVLTVNINLIRFGPSDIGNVSHNYRFTREKIKI